MMALILVFVAFGIGIAIYLNVLHNDALALRSKAATLLKKISQESRLEDRLIDESLSFPPFRVEKKISAHPDQWKGLYILSLEAFDEKNRLIFEQKEFLKVESKR